MATDPLLEKRLRNVRRFELLLSILSPEEKQTAITGSDESLTNLLTQKGIKDKNGAILSRQDWLSLRDYVAQQEKKELIPEEKSRLAQTLASAGITGGILGFAALKRERKVVPPPTPPGPQTRFQQMENAGEKITEGSGGDSTWGKTEEIPVSMAPAEPKKENDQAQSIPRSILEDKPTEAAPNLEPKVDINNPTFNQVDYYPDPEIMPASDIDTWGTPEPVSPPPTPLQPSPEPIPQSQQPTQQPISSRSSSPRQSRSKKVQKYRDAKAMLKKRIKAQVKKKVFQLLLSTIEVWGPVVATILLVFLIMIIVLALGCSIVNNPVGDALGVNYCGNHPLEAPPTPIEQEKPTSITFIGGEAYLTTADSCRVNCPAGNKGDKTTVKIEIFIDTSKLDRDPNNIRASLQISNKFFANITASGNPQIISVPVDTTYFAYQWRLPNTGETIRHYTFDVTGTIQAETGDTNAVLSMSGVTLTADGSTEGDNGGLFDGANSRPSTKTCNEYGGIMDDIKNDFPKSSATNYGDPTCNYKDEKLRKVIEQTEKNTANWDMWTSIAKCESGSPNGYSPAADGGGAWGKFQMRRSFPEPFKVWKEGESRGDVTWQKQVENAVTYNNSLNADGKNFSYWGTARCLCYYAKFKSTSSCQDILKRGEIRTPNSGQCSSCTAQQGSQ